MTQTTVAPGLVSVIICTRNRPEDLDRCLRSVLGLQFDAFEIVVIDQSRDDRTQQVAAHASAAAKDVAGLRRFHYERSSGVGLSPARNAGLRLAQGAIIAFTDDDCTVPADWLRRVQTALARDDSAGVLFGALEAAPHDAQRWFVPTFEPRADAVTRSRFARAHQLGVGADMIVRHELIDAIGDFDERLGAGCRFPSAEDVDLAYRALKRGFSVLGDPTVRVVHWGMREYSTGAARRLIRGSYIGIGACYALHIRRGDLVAAFLLVQEMALVTIQAFNNLLQRRHPVGMQRLTGLAQGASRALAAPA